MNQRNVPKFVPIADLVYSFGVEKETEGQKITITDSKLTFRRLGRVHIAGILLNVVEKETSNGKKLWLITVSDGYTVTLRTFNPSVGLLAKENVGNLVEITATSRIHIYNGREYVRWYAESLAPTQPENFIAQQIMILKNLKNDLGTLDPETMINTYEELMKIYTDDKALDDALEEVLTAKKVPAKKKIVFKKQSRDKKLKLVADYYGWPQEMLRYIVDKIDYEAWILEQVMSYNEEEVSSDSEDSEFEVDEIE